jgi:Ca-activated chloride channel family protein
MNELFRFLKPEMVVLLFSAPIAIFIRIWTLRETDRRINAFAAGGTRWRIAPRPPVSRRVMAIILLTTGLIFLTAAAMRPQGDPEEVEVTAKGRDLVFLIDVSRSMLAQDLPPNRLERTILAIRELVPHLQGDRVGLVVFSGNAALKCPLTLDYEFFLAVLENIGPHDVSRGGTNVGDALRVIGDRMLNEEGRYQDIILISDGEDHDSYAVEAAGMLAEEGVRIHAVGIGSIEGARIPDPDRPGRYLTHNGETVHSSLNETLLKTVASATPGGSYLPARTGNFDLHSLYSDVIVSEEEHAIQSGMKMQWREWFQAPLLLGLLLLGLEAIIRGKWNA